MTPQAGDFGVVRTHGWVGTAIRLVTRSRYSHAYVHMGDGTVVEAQTHGAMRKVFRYEHVPHLDSTDVIKLSANDRWAIKTHANFLVGVPYGWADIVSVGLLQYGIRPRWLRKRVSMQRNLICSQLVDQAYENAGIHLFNDGRLPMDVTPGDLGRLIQSTKKKNARR